MPRRYEERGQNQENQRFNDSIAHDLAVHRVSLCLVDGHVHRMNPFGTIGKNTTSKEASFQCL
jgi:hypothetical protein